jgi:hypothetical protein
MDYTTRNYLDLKKNKNIYMTNITTGYIDNRNLLLDSSPFDLLYANIKERASSSMPRPPSDP